MCDSATIGPTCNLNMDMTNKRSCFQLPVSSLSCNIRYLLFRPCFRVVTNVKFWQIHFFIDFGYFLGEESIGNNPDPESWGVRDIFERPKVANVVFKDFASKFFSA